MDGNAKTVNTVSLLSEVFSSNQSSTNRLRTEHVVPNQVCTQQNIPNEVRTQQASTQQASTDRSNMTGIETSPTGSIETRSRGAKFTNTSTTETSISTGLPQWSLGVSEFQSDTSTRGHGNEPSGHIVWASTQGDIGRSDTLLPGEIALFPEELAEISRAAIKRVTEYTTVRILARRALRELGVATGAIRRGERGAPLWPRGVVGTMTHCDSFRGVAVARQQDVRSLGVDAEPVGSLSEGVLRLVSLPSEREWISAVSMDSTLGKLPLDKLLFCAKESIYKAWFPITRQWLGFEDAHIRFTVNSVSLNRTESASLSRGEISANEQEQASLLYPVASGTFHARILVDAIPIDGEQPITSMEGRWSIRNGLIVTGIVIAHL